MAPQQPDLRNVSPEDLSSTERLLGLFGQATKQGLLPDSEAGLLRFVGAAEHARTIGTRNPCGLFVHLVRRKRWEFITQADEDAALARIKRHRYGRTRRASIPPRRTQRVELSEDALLVRQLQHVLRRRGLHRDPFPKVQRHRPDWTRERWERAVLELHDAQLAQARENAGISELLTPFAGPVLARGQKKSGAMSEALLQPGSGG